MISQGIQCRPSAKVCLPVLLCCIYREDDAASNPAVLQRSWNGIMRFL